MSAPWDISSTLPQESTEDENDREPAFTAPGSAPPDGASFASPQETVSSSVLDVLWCKAFEQHYGLQRPTDAAEIHVFRVLLQSSWDKNTCTRSVTSPLSDPFQTLERIIDEWSDLEIEEENQSWRLPRRTEPWGPFSIHFTALKMNPPKGPQVLSPLMCLLRLGPLRCHVSITGNGISRAETKI